ncbi:hypothetical protein D3C85_1432580 [compost metagenome]
MHSIDRCQLILRVLEPRKVITTVVGISLFLGGNTVVPCALRVHPVFELRADAAEPFVGSVGKPRGV